MLISTIRKIKNTRKVIKFTFITGILLTIWSIYYLMTPDCFTLTPRCITDKGYCRGRNVRKRGGVALLQGSTGRAYKVRHYSTPNIH